MLITIDQLELGDEIIVPSNSNLKYVKVLKQPQLRSKPRMWESSPDGYKSVKVSIYNKNINGTYSIYTCNANVDEHNDTMYLDLNYVQIWLVKRDGKPVIR